MTDFDAQVREEPSNCPGGFVCMCCNSYCDCGYRNECPVFRSIVRRRIKMREKIAEEKK